MVKVVIEKVTKMFKKLRALDEVSLEIENGSFFCLLGPSGSGKTTLMRIIAGLETPTSGRVYFDGEDVTDLSPVERNVAMVFQFPSIYPSLNVYQNIALPIKREVRSKEEEKERVEWAAELLQIKEHLYKRASQIDFGILQRVSIAKAIVRKANVYIFDEPLSNLDTKMRESLRAELQNIHKEAGGTYIYVTHDQSEAMAVADRIGLLLDGKLQQVGSPEEIYYKPASRFVAYFIGSPTINFITSSYRFEDGKLYLSVGDQYVVASEVLKNVVLNHFKPGEEFEIAIRPQDISLSIHPRSNSVLCEVTSIESLGTSIIGELKVGMASFRALFEPDLSIKEGDKVYAVLDPDRIHVIDTRTERVLV
jgi:ABC-type sugar transport system ATPase subunit